MKTHNPLNLLAVTLLCACSPDAAVTAATTAKLQAEQARQGQAQVERVRQKLGDVMKAAAIAASVAEGR